MELGSLSRAKLEGMELEDMVTDNVPSVDLQLVEYGLPNTVTILQSFVALIELMILSIAHYYYYPNSTLEQV